MICNVKTLQTAEKPVTYKTNFVEEHVNLI